MRNSITVLMLLSISIVHAQVINFRDLNWKQVATKMPDEWYGSAEAKMAADSVLKYQTVAGGWFKNQNFHKGVDQKEWAEVQKTGIGATIDNGATTTEMLFLAKAYNKTKNERYAEAFIKGLRYLIEAQYENGGWPQFYPIRPGRVIAYNAHIMFNDNAMINVMRLLRDVINQKPIYTNILLQDDLKSQIKQAFDKGLSCILNTQIKTKGELTVWCAQHDEKTLDPANARAFELASFSGQESAGIVLFLMEIDNPSDAIKNAVRSAVSWFDQHKIEKLKLEEFINSEGKKDKHIVTDTNAAPIWARFYDLEIAQPFFCDRDGVKRTRFEEIGYERRNGYAWYTYEPAQVLAKYTKWSEKYADNYQR